MTKNSQNGEQYSTATNHGFKLGFGDGEPVRWQSTWLAGDWWAWCSLDVVDGIVA
jgi:hypothetical protein